MDLIIQHVLQQHMKRCFNFRFHLKSMDFEGKNVPKKLHVLDQTPLLTSCLSKFKQENLRRKDFMTVSNNMVVILLQYVASLFENGGILCDKKEFASLVCGVFVERSNNPIEIDFGLVYPEAPIGKLCIRTDISNGEPG